MECPKCGEMSYISKSKPIGNFRVGFIYEDSKGHKYGYSREMTWDEVDVVGRLRAIVGC